MDDTMNSSLGTLEHFRRHIEARLPLVPLFNIDIIKANASRGVVRLREGEHVTRPGGSVAGCSSPWPTSPPMCLADRKNEACVTADLTINFLRPLIVVATSLLETSEAVGLPV